MALTPNGAGSTSDGVDGTLEVRVVGGLEGIAADAWDRLCGEHDPFVEHAFLSTLERAGAVGEGTGWVPLHVVAYDGDALVGALPLYLKDHSYGEYIFDWGWADASERMGMPYYPKLVSMAPVTPATGRRILLAPEVESHDDERDRVTAALLAGVREVAELTKASSVHLLFVTEAERDLVTRLADFIPRLSMQFHWRSEGWSDFDAYLGAMRSSVRKQLRRERRTAAESGLDIRVVPGDALTAAEWRWMGRFYRDTCARKGSYPYLPERFFELAADTLRARALAVIAYDAGEPVAATLNFQKGQHLYGRYWGCRDDYPMLHFELCYYRLIEHAIAQGITRFEAGAQGSHKLKRGLMPAEVHSVHWIRQPVLRDAVSDFCRREAVALRERIDELAEMGPFKTRNKKRGIGTRDRS